MICSVWVALDDVPAERGLGYVRGSHRAKLVHRVTNFSGDDHSDKNTYSGAAELPPVPEVTDDDEVLRWDMEPGDALLAVNGQAVHSATAAGELISSAPPGAPVVLRVRARPSALTVWLDGATIEVDEQMRCVASCGPDGAIQAGDLLLAVDGRLLDSARDARVALKLARKGLHSLRVVR